ncbi:SRPBCC family protein [Nocardia puris]|uniref:SRPBCC family protein n=1 Tax=Nocardia puris TaxID=208602 RepID=UPI001895AB87|nr:SRPBCC family protein [Nocardia puris]MBF6210692.1 SRPBCC family protein [Nocardia puris]MBF6364299.1 SRPBCC family protein [Nocardia puris]MBF6459228.1 SRPBCC family protein [Nocardia puris]
MLDAELTVPVSAPAAFGVLADGWLYASWVVGASHIREVDPGWPEVGTRIHYSVGLWPVMARDVTTVRAVDPPRLLELEARLWPVGSARILLELDEFQPGETRIRMTEHAVSGPAALIPGDVQRLAIKLRNQESLSRLAHLIVGRAAR